VQFSEIHQDFFCHTHTTIFGFIQARPHSSPDPSCGRENSAEVLPNPFPQKNSFGKTESVLKPHHLPEELRAESRKNVLFLLEEKIGRARNQKSREHFCGTRKRSERWWGNSITDFENRCELGKIKTPIQKLGLEKKPIKLRGDLKWINNQLF
jgi:hypothetical protein